MMQQRARLVLADGTLFEGFSVGVPGFAVGEVVFNTAMTGYQEIFSDPSYAHQLITLTMPHVGNTGCNDEDLESSQIWAAGLILRNFSNNCSHFRAQYTLADWLRQQNKVAIAGIDTRALTQHLRDYGVMSGCISTLDEPIAVTQKRASELQLMTGRNLTQVVTCKTTQSWEEGRGYWNRTNQNKQVNLNNNVTAGKHYHVVVYDFGVKHSILRILYDYGCQVTVVPADTLPEKVMELNPDGVVFSNGPGDPAACKQAIESARYFLNNNMPLYGICLGFQILALACGAQIIKMKLGHHGSNHPVLESGPGLQQKVVITSQNHGFAVDESTLPKYLSVTHRSLFDNSLQGIMHLEKPAFGFQGHPEASPGPHDIEDLFGRFIDKMRIKKSKGV